MDNIDTKALWLTVMGDKNPSLTTEEIQTSVYLVLEQTKLSARVLAVEVWIESILSSQGESAWSEDKVYVTTGLFPCVPQGDWLALAALKLVWINFHVQQAIDVCWRWRQLCLWNSFIPCKPWLLDSFFLSPSFRIFWS